MSSDKVEEISLEQDAPGAGTPKGEAPVNPASPATPASVSRASDKFKSVVKDVQSGAGSDSARSQKARPPSISKTKWNHVARGLEILAMPSSSRERREEQDPLKRSHRTTVVISRLLLSIILLGLLIQIVLRYTSASSSVINQKKVMEEIEFPSVTLCPLSGGATMYEATDIPNGPDVATCTTDFGATCDVTGYLSLDMSFGTLTECIVINGKFSSAAMATAPLQKMTITTFVKESELAGFTSAVAFLHPQDFAANNDGVNTTFVTISADEASYLLITKRTEEFLNGDTFVKYRTQTSSVDLHPDRLAELQVGDYRPTQLNIMYDSMFVQNLIEKPPPGFLDFIAEFGGLGSLLIGLSIVLLGEYVFELLEGVYFDRRRSNEVQKVDNSRLESGVAAAEGLSRAQRRRKRADPKPIEVLVSPDFVAAMLRDEETIRNRVYFVTFFMRVTMTLSLIVYTVILTIKFTNTNASPSTIEFDARTVAPFPSVTACPLESGVQLLPSCGGISADTTDGFENCFTQGGACSLEHMDDGSNCIRLNGLEPIVMASAPQEPMDILLFVNRTMTTEVYGASFLVHPFGSEPSLDGSNTTLFTAPFSSHTYVQTTNNHEKILDGPLLSNFVTKTAHLPLSRMDEALQATPECALMRVSLSYDSLTLETVTENPPPGWLDYVAQFGGTSGLLMGLSIGGFVEYVFSFIHSRRMLAKKKERLTQYRAEVEGK